MYRDIYVNGYNSAPPELPFGGRKESGFGKDYIMYTHIYIYICVCVCMYTYMYMV